MVLFILGVRVMQVQCMFGMGQLQLPRGDFDGRHFDSTPWTGKVSAGMKSVVERDA